MTLLSRIIERAESEGSVPELLRMTRTLAYRAGAEDLRVWTERELNGYVLQSDVPAYRGPFSLPVYASFHDEYGRTFPNVPIDRRRFPEEWRDGPWFDHIFREPISAIQSYADEELVRFEWSPDHVLNYNLAVLEDKIHPVMDSRWNMSSAEIRVPKSVFVGMLDQVRTMVHGLALEVEQSTPTAGDPGASSEDNRKAAITITQNFNFNNVDMSGANNAIGSSDFVQNSTTSIKGDRVALEHTLQSAGVTPADLQRLQEAIREDPEDHQGQPGSRVRAWLSEQTAGVAPAVATVITQAVFAFLGLPPVS